MLFKEKNRAFNRINTFERLKPPLQQNKCCHYYCVVIWAVAFCSVDAAVCFHFKRQETAGPQGMIQDTSQISDTKLFETKNCSKEQKSPWPWSPTAMVIQSGSYMVEAAGLKQLFGGLHTVKDSAEAPKVCTWWARRMAKRSSCLGHLGHRMVTLAKLP